MKRLDYFTGASPGWRDRVADRLDATIGEYGAGAEAYVRRRIRDSHWGSYQRRRWTLALILLKRRKRQDSTR